MDNVIYLEDYKANKVNKSTKEKNINEIDQIAEEKILNNFDRLASQMVISLRILGVKTVFIDLENALAYFDRQLGDN